MSADVEGPLRRRPAADLARPLEHVVRCQALLQLAPNVDALDQRPRLVVARPAGGQRRVEVQMTVDERRGRQAALRLDDLRRARIEICADPGEAPVLDPHVDNPLADTYVANEEVHRVTVNGWRSLRTGRWTPR